MSHFPPFSIRTNTNTPLQNFPGPIVPWNEPRKVENVLRHKYGRINDARVGDEGINSVQRFQNPPYQRDIKGFENASNFWHTVGQNPSSHENDVGHTYEVPLVVEQGGCDSRKRPLNADILKSTNTFASTSDNLETQGTGRKRRRTLDTLVSNAGVLNSDNGLPKVPSNRLSFQGERAATSDIEISIKQTKSVRSNPATPTMRPANVHASAALFRRSSSSAKKQTRLPMSKLFTSLELSPEEFLDLQAEAKAFMLDPSHPERRDCIGNKGAGDGDRARLRLHSCVREFLADHQGTGERFFGHSSPSGATRRHVWPNNELEVIDICTPLLRRMVTNERQRQYAFENRQSTGRKRLSGGEETRHVEPNMSEVKESMPAEEPGNASNVKEEVTLRLIIMQARSGSSKIISRSSHALSLSGNPSPSTRMNDLVNFTCAQLGTWPKTREVKPDSANRKTALALKALSPKEGVQDISSDEDLDKLIFHVRQSIWMEGELRVMAEAF